MPAAAAPRPARQGTDPEVPLLHAEDVLRALPDGPAVTASGQDRPVDPYLAHATGLVLAHLTQAHLTGQPASFQADLAVAGLAAATRSDRGRSVAQFRDTLLPGLATTDDPETGQGTTVIGVGDGTAVIAGTIAESLNATYTHTTDRHDAHPEDQPIPVPGYGTLIVADHTFLTGSGPLIIVTADTRDLSPLRALIAAADPARSRRVVIATLNHTNPGQPTGLACENRLTVVGMTTGPVTTSTEPDPADPAQVDRRNVHALPRGRGVYTPWDEDVPASPTRGVRPGATRRLDALATSAGLRIHTSLRVPAGGNVLLVADHGLEHSGARTAAALADLCLLHGVNVALTTTAREPLTGHALPYTTPGLNTHTRYVHGLTPGEFHTVVVVTTNDQQVTDLARQDSLAGVAASTGADVLVVGLPAHGRAVRHDKARHTA